MSAKSSIADSAVVEPIADIEEEKTTLRDSKKDNNDGRNGGDQKEKKTVGLRKDSNYLKKKNISIWRHSGSAGAYKVLNILYTVKIATVKVLKDQNM
jgi:hypothetical protein